MLGNGIRYASDRLPLPYPSDAVSHSVISHPHWDLPLAAKNTLLENYKTVLSLLSLSYLWHA